MPTSAEGETTQGHWRRTNEDQSLIKVRSLEGTMASLGPEDCATKVEDAAVLKRSGQDGSRHQDGCRLEIFLTAVDSKSVRGQEFASCGLQACPQEVHVAVQPRSRAKVETFPSFVRTDRVRVVRPRRWAEDPSCWLKAPKETIYESMLS